MGGVPWWAHAEASPPHTLQRPAIRQIWYRIEFIYRDMGRGVEERQREGEEERKGREGVQSVHTPAHF